MTNEEKFTEGLKAMANRLVFYPEGKTSPIPYDTVASMLLKGYRVRPQMDFATVYAPGKGPVSDGAR